MSSQVSFEPAISLDAHLQRVDVFKIGLRNSFQIDFRSARSKKQSAKRCKEGGESNSELFHYLGEVLPLIEPRARAMPKGLRRAYETLRERAEESFWQIYSDFQPMLQSIAQASGIESDQLQPVLGRSVLLFDASRKTKFVTYLEKSLRESVKNLRGKQYAEDFGIPLSAGRLVPQMLWQLDQAAMGAGHSLSNEDADLIVLNFLAAHPTRFSAAMMQRIAHVIRGYRKSVSLDNHELLEPSAPTEERAAGNDCYLEQSEENSHQLRQIMNAISLAQFNENETALVLHRLGLHHDERVYADVASKVTVSSLRKRKQRLLVRLLASRFSSQSPHFGRYLNESVSKSRDKILRQIGDLAEEMGRTKEEFVEKLLNWMSLTDCVYKISILDRERLLAFLLVDRGMGPSPKGTLTTPLFQKLKAALIEQDRLGFPCLGA